jgi:CRP/FNR family transcriptional regulator, anaerobic regulatory protein
MLEDRSVNTQFSADAVADFPVRTEAPSELRDRTSQTAPPSCSTCYLQRVCLPCGSTLDELEEVDAVVQRKRKVQRGAAIYARGDRFESLYAIHSGAFKSVTSSSARQSKVTGLHLPADLLGLDAISSEIHQYDAIAVEDSEVCVLPYPNLIHLTVRLPSVQAHVLTMMSRDIARDSGLVLRLGHMDAEQRVGAFLVALSERYIRLGYPGNRFDMRLTREDIASYLGLTAETVSRVFSRLQSGGFIDAQRSQVNIKELPKLRQLVG